MNTTDFIKLDNNGYQYFTNPSVIEKDLQTLSGIITGIKCDNTINDVEYKNICSWLNSYKQYENKQPYKEVINLVRNAINDKFLTHEEAHNIIWFCDQYTKRTQYFDAITSGIQKLLGIIHGIIIDSEINIAELKYLDNWLEDNEYLKNSWPYDELYSLVTSILRDHIITQDEHDELIRFCNAISNNQNHDSNADITSILKTGFHQIDPNVIIPESTFCITGISKKYKRKDIADRIELYGGYVVNNISSKVNYLVVCNEKNTCWAFTCYGRKIEQAINHRKQGANLVIIHEFDLYDALEDLS